MNKKILIAASIIVGIFFIYLTFIYWTVPAKSLPSFLPGHEAGNLKTHFKHGIGTLILGLGSFIFAWFQSGTKSPDKK